MGPNDEVMVQRMAKQKQLVEKMQADQRWPSGKSQELIKAQYEDFILKHPVEELLADQRWICANAQSTVFGPPVGQALTDVIKDILSAGRPASLIRLGDGEGNILAAYDQEFPLLYGFGTGRILEMMFGSSNYDNEELSRLYKGMQDAILTADVLGIPSEARITNTYTATGRMNLPDLRGTPGTLNAVRLTRKLIQSAGVSHPLVTDCFFHRNLLPHYQSLLGGIEGLGIITCHPELASLLEDQFSIRKVESYLIPNQFMVARQDAGQHYPGVFDQTLDKIKSAGAAKVYLVAAGILGKLYCAEIKRLGAVAIDIGSVVEGWVGKKSRPYHTSDFIEKWRLGDSAKPAAAPNVIAAAKKPDPVRIVQKAHETQAAGPRIIKAVTAGRTGTNYIAKLFSIVPGVLSLHEPAPNYVLAMRRGQQDPEICRQFVIEKKIPFIRQQKAAVYIESSHLFCKGFFEPMVWLGRCPDLMLITRSPRKIASSLLAKKTVPARTTAGFSFLLQPSDHNVLPLPRWEKMSDYQLCYWYALEIERRQQHYANIAKSLGSTVVSFSAEMMNDYDEFLRICQTLQLNVQGNELLAKHTEVSSVLHNKTKESDEQKEEVIDFVAEESEVLEAIRAFEPLIALSHFNKLQEGSPSSASTLPA